MGAFDGFCSTPYWMYIDCFGVKDPSDSKLTWESDNPDFTPCFEKTALAWTPCLFLFVFSPLEIFYIRSSTNGEVRWNWLNVSKLLLNAAALVLSVVSLISAATNPDDAFPVDYVTPVIRIISFSWAALLLMWNRSRGLRTSGLLTLFWFLKALFNVAEFRTEIIAETSERAEAERGQLSFVLAMILFPVLVLIFLLNCLADHEPTSSPFTKVEDRCPEFDASFINKIFFGWYDRMAWKGFRRPLEQKDLWELNPMDMSTGVVPLFFSHWNKQNKKADAKAFASAKPRKAVSVLPALFRSFGGPFVFAAAMELCGNMLTFVSPQILKRLIAFTVDVNEPMWKGLVYAGAMLITALVQTLLMSQYNIRMNLVGMRVRTALVAAIYRKSLRMSNVARKDKTVGEIVTLMSVDAQRFLDLGGLITMVWSAPIQIIVALYFLWDILGVSVLAGLASMILLIPVNGVIANKMKTLQIKQMKNKDERAKLMNEILNGMKVLKLYAWEPPFADRINSIRLKEMDVLKKSAYLQAGISFAFTVAPFLVTLVSFTTFVLIDENNILDAQTAFVSLSLFNILRFPLAMLPMVIMLVVQSGVSIKRIDAFLNAPDLDEDSVQHCTEEASGALRKLAEANGTDGPGHGPDHARGTVAPIHVRDGTFAWGPGEEPVLRDVQLTVPKGALVAVVGMVGAGKTSLLSAMLGEMEKLSGSVNTVGSIAYVPQQAWIQNAKLRDNILFAKTYDPHLYTKVVDACALKADLAMLAAGDQTEIGEKGINLSGGQKQRVSLARAVYNDADVYLLDDPLSAVDSHVGKHIFDQVIGPTGLLRHKTRVLVTHGVAFLHRTDHIVVLKDGVVSEQGSYDQLVESKGAFAEFLVQHLQEAEEDGIAEDLQEIKAHLEKAVGKEELQRQISQVSLSGSDGMRSRKDSVASGSFKRHGSGRRRSSVLQADALALPPKGDDEVAGQNLTEAETIEMGSVKLKVFWHYMRSLGLVLSALTILFNLALQGFSIGSNLWVDKWTGDTAMYNPKDPDFEAKRNTYLGVYAAFGGAQAIFSMTSSYVFAMGCIASSMELHNGMFRRILKCPMSFFDMTPIGRILNRFTKDIDNVDNVLPLQIRQALNLFFSCVATLLVISISTPLFVSVIIPLGVVYFFVQRFYVSTSRQLKRLDAVSRSPIYSHFSETLTGSASIRAYGAVDRFIQEVEARVDKNQKCYFPVAVANRWLAVRLETVGNSIIFFAALFAVLSRGDISSGTVGLSISYALQITLALNWLVRFVSEVENNIVSVERIKEYEETPQELPWTNKQSHVDAAWPTQGTVEFKKYAIRYREGLDLVLKGIDVSVKGGEKVGIVGRTGAGKSSLTLGLFRLVEAASGQILIDGVDIASVDLHTLRSRVTIIPQDPVLFTGSLRINVDPYNKHSDEEVWRALERSHLKDLVQGFAGGLNHEMTEGGENLSVGQRQLVCLARALLRKTKVLVFDEATAAVDLETDDLIQKTIREDFKECTILTIAHRLNTIMDSNRVLVLEQGEVAEFDSPQNLLQKKDSMFYSLAKDAGLV
ncbi:Canalicular multispecific organic anion transporter 2 [Frankliniella fusca]|uniref:ABC-type glutathione-S-conjugate transporter n=1 Tax=Frankliniella fusca TaxID=407009 RepID=A0AAE1LB00_9NEOP|nr:Canalicular multispecific organic anion transporter 2 [Frankliniella fusca]